MNLDPPFVPPDLFTELLPTNTDTSDITGMCSTVMTLTVVYFCHPILVNSQATTVWQTPGIIDMSTLHALRG
jgi:hypothetical protein